MGNIANRRVFLERANALVKKSSPDLNDMHGVCEALSFVMSDMLGMRCRIVVNVGVKALEDAIAVVERAERGTQ